MAILRSLTSQSPSARCQAGQPDAHQAAVECFFDIVQAMRPGVTFGELKAAAEKSSPWQGHGALTLHGRGLGDDGPLITPQSQPAVDSVPLLEGSVFVVKPDDHL